MNSYTFRNSIICQCNFNWTKPIKMLAFDSTMRVLSLPTGIMWLSFNKGHFSQFFVWNYVYICFSSVDFPCECGFVFRNIISTSNALFCVHLRSKLDEHCTEAMKFSSEWVQFEIEISTIFCMMCVIPPENYFFGIFFFLD